jgi:hypothetical protein
MDLPLLKNDITNKLGPKKPVVLIADIQGLSR